MPFIVDRSGASDSSNANSTSTGRDDLEQELLAETTEYSEVDEHESDDAALEDYDAALLDVEQCILQPGSDYAHAMDCLRAKRSALISALPSLPSHQSEKAFVRLNDEGHVYEQAIESLKQAQAASSK